MKKIEDVEHIQFDDAPETWDDRCSGDGYERIINEKAKEYLPTMEFLLV